MYRQMKSGNLNTALSGEEVSNVIESKVQA